MTITCSCRSFHAKRSILRLEFARPYCTAQRKDLRSPWRNHERHRSSGDSAVPSSLPPTHLKRRAGRLYHGQAEAEAALPHTAARGKLSKDSDYGQNSEKATSNFYFVAPN